MQSELTGHGQETRPSGGGLGEFEERFRNFRFYDETSYRNVFRLLV